MDAREFLNLEGISADDRTLAGVSGGHDSVALLHLLLEAGQQNLVVCHLDHQLRPESGDDAAFVRAFAESRGCQVEIGAIDVRALAAAEKLSLEAAARKARLRFFAECAARHQTSHIFLGHHARDQAETVLINLLRGSGSSGLSAMNRVSRMTFQNQELELIRPLLHRQPDEILRFPGVAELPFREDESNSSDAFFRNRIRHRVLPTLNEVADRDVVPALCRAADLLGEEDAFLDQLSSELLKDASIEGSPALSTPVLREAALPLQRRAIHTWLQMHSVPDIGFDLVESVRVLLTPSPDSPARVNLPGGTYARRREKRLFVDSGESGK